MRTLKASHLSFERLFEAGPMENPDVLCIEYAVRWWQRRGYFEIERRGASVTVDVEQLQWVIDCLCRIREELPRDVLP